MILHEIQQKLNPFTENNTGVSRYNSWLRDPKIAENEGFNVEIRQLSPQQYLDSCCYGFKCSMQQLLSTRQDSDKISKYQQDMEKGDKFPMLVLQFTRGGGFTQEGIHRAVAALNINITSVPVMLITEQ